MKSFPKNFLWGSATSAHQIEGGNLNDWTEWEHANSARLAAEAAKRHANTPMRVPDYILKRYLNPLQEENYISGRGTDHYHRFEEDFDIAKSLGHTAYRFSLEWSRIEPKEGEFDEKVIEHYRRVIKALRRRGIEPFVTLWHWTNPIWIRDIGGWENKKTTKYFIRYVKKVVSEFSDVRFWITINEPMVWGSQAYLKGEWPPQRRNFYAHRRVFKNLVDGHKGAYEAIHQSNSDTLVGIAKNNIRFGGIAILLKRWWWNHRFLDAICDYQDLIGVNYYFGSCRSDTKSDMGWDICPEGIYHVLKDLRRYKKPIYITENGLADARDIHREKFTKEHLRWVHKAIEEGVDVRGYFYWSLLDNFEWDKGFWPRFGLVSVDYKTLKRTIRPSAWAYAKIAKTNTLDI